MNKIILVLGLMLSALPSFGQIVPTPSRTSTSGGSVSITAGSAIIGKVGIDQTTPGVTNGVQLTAGTAIAGKFGIDQTTPGTTNGVQLTAGTAVAGKFGIDQTTPGTTNLVYIKDSAGNSILASTDPCDGVIPTAFETRVTSTTVVKLITKSTGLKNYICDFVLANAGATMERVIIIEGTLTTTECDTGATKIFGGSTTVANGFPLGANGGGVARSITYPGTAVTKDTCIAIQGISNDTLVSGHFVQL